MTSETQGKESTNGYVTCLGIGCGGLILLGILVFAGFYLTLYFHSINETDAVKQCTLRQIMLTLNPRASFDRFTNAGVNVDRGFEDAVNSLKCLSDLNISPFNIVAREVRDGRDLSIGYTEASMTVDGNAKMKILFWIASYKALGLSFAKILGIHNIQLSTSDGTVNTGIVDGWNQEGQILITSVYMPSGDNKASGISDFIKTKNEESQKKNLNR